MSSILNQENVVKYFGMSDFPRADVAELSGDEYQLSASKGYIKVKKIQKISQSQITMF
ncbi:MAG: hypothetical protein F6K24_43125 [Okeania sp. SIO2D1]|nr:hypothetical protein [Okeania sp. SIO2D1]